MKKGSSWESFCDGFLQAFQEELGNKRCYGCPLAAVGMELVFQDEELAELCPAVFMKGIWYDTVCSRIRTCCCG